MSMYDDDPKINVHFWFHLGWGFGNEYGTILVKSI